MSDWMRHLSEGDLGALLANAGGILAKNMIAPNWNWRDVLIALVWGTVFVLWIAPGIAEHFELGPKVYGSMCFLFGMFGLQLSRGTLRLAAAFSKDPESCLKRWRK